nr:serine hydrolase-like protein 2 isoform X1 [Odocoileus virginianus texanus]
MGLISELKLAVPWGHIAAKAWGSHQAAPVLCLHGWLDNANSFDRLIPLLPKDFHYVAMDFGGHGLSSHYSQGFPYYHQNFVSEVRRVAAALKWNRFSLLGHSFGGTVGGMFSCIFPEMVDKLILLEALPVVLDTNEMDNLLTYKRRAIEHVLQVEASRKPAQVVSPEEMLQWFLKNNSHVDEACGKHLLQRGTTQVATGVSLNRDRRIILPEYCLDIVSRELLVQYIKNLQARILLVNQRPSAASGLHSPLNILSGGAQVPPPLHCIHPGPGTWQEPCLPGTRLLSTGVQKAGTHGGKSQPQGGTLHTLWDI